MKRLTASLMKRFRWLIVLWIKITGFIFKSQIYFYVTTVQRRIFDRHKLTTNAAAISFFFLLSMIPMLFIVIAIISSFVQSPEEAEQFMVSYVTQRVPESARAFIMEIVMRSNLIHNVKSLMENKGWVTVVSVASLLWTSSGAFAAIEDAMTTIFGVKGRNYFISRLVEISMVLITGSLFMLSNMVNVIIQMLKRQGSDVLGIDFSNLPYVWNVATTVMPYALTIAMFFIMYKVLPKTTVYERAALLGATVAGVLLELSIFGFAYYVDNFSKYDAFYGSVAGIIITIFSVYLASIILLIGAEVTEIANTKIESAKELALTVKELQ
ncbi:YihY/virulence factor BrkB family protein [bacterium]|nr:YihY/virulence factor BrkB family protein [bacterium]